MAALPFKVKAVYEYKSPHEEDLSFPNGQIITVTEEEDDDWYVGEYTDASGGSKSGLFPKNFVERYEPAPPPRPVRASRAKPAETPAVAANLAPAQTAEPEYNNVQDEPPKEAAAPAAASEPPEPTPAPVSVASTRSPEIPTEPFAAPKPASPPVSNKAPPPAVAEKPSSFRDRIAAFNKAAAPPVAPFKPSGLSSSTFIKKPFVAPPPSRNAYVPPPRDPAPQKIYRREEDPEIAERRAQDQEDAERAGLLPASGDQEEDDNDEDEAPKAVSLKERIALLQKQQMEQAARRAEPKEKPKRPPKKRLDSRDAEEGESGEQAAEEPTRHSSDTPRDAPDVARRVPRGPKPPEVPRPDMLSDGNDADQSAAGETTEDAEADSTSVEEHEEVYRSEKHPAALAAPASAHQQPVERREEEESTEEDEEEEEEEEEEVENENDGLDEETRHQMALRERMAKLSGGMGMAGMFGPPPGMPGLIGSAAATKRKKAPERKPAEDAEPSPTPSQAPRVPVIPMPGMGRSMASESVGADEADMRMSSSTVFRESEDVDSAYGVARSAPPPPPQERPTNSETITDRRPPSPPVTTTRAAPPPPPQAPLASPSAGSESDDEMPGISIERDHAPAPPIPWRDGPPSLSSSDIRSPPPLPPVIPPTPGGAEQTSPTSFSSTSPRSARAPPPIPTSPPMQSRPPPPPPPSGAPPVRDSAAEALHKRTVRANGEGESEYEGDYDTDIASSAKHKDALKSHAREPSLDDSTVAADDGPMRSAPIPPIVRTSTMPSSGTPRGAPPPPPGRTSMDSPRVVPPPVPSREAGPLPEGDYDPYRYQAPPPIPRTAPALPKQVPVMSAPGSGQARGPPPVPAAMDEESEEDDEENLYSSPPPRVDRAAPPPPPPPLQNPPIAERSAPPPPSGPPSRPPRQSAEGERSFTTPSRKSTDQGRPSVDQAHMAHDVDLGKSSQWWAHPSNPPPTFQNRSDILFESEESTSSKRGGKTTVSKDVYILYMDYSQTIVTARFDARNVEDVQLNQRHEPPPPRLRQDQLEEAHDRYGAKIAEEVATKQNTIVGDGTPQALIMELLKSHKSALSPIGTRAYGALVYANLANATVQQFDEIRPGDIVSFRNAKFQGKHGGVVHQKYSMEAGKPDHVGVVMEWDGSKRKLRVYEQGRESKKCKPESFRLGDLRSGEVRVWRIMPRRWVGWEGDN